MVGVGIVRIKMFDEIVRMLADVKHVPDLKRNLISLSTLDSKGSKYTSEGGALKVSKGALVVMKGQKRTANLYILYGTTITGDAVVASKSMTDGDVTRLWHMRLGHMSENGMNGLSRRGLFDGQSKSKLKFCEHCFYRKQRQVKFFNGILNTKGTFDCLHSNLWRPSKVPSNEGANYMFSIIDDFSRRVWSFFFKHKSDVFATFKEWKIMIEKQTRKQIECLPTNNGLKICSEEFNALCRSKGIVIHHTMVGTP